MEMSDEKRTFPTATDNDFSPLTKWYGSSNFCLVLKGSCLKQKNGTYTLIIEIFFIVYKLDIWSRYLKSYFIL